MSDPSLPLQAGLVAALAANGDVFALIGNRVYDQVPEKTLPAFPYVTLGAGQVLPDKADCIDGVEIFPVIEVWSRAIGFVETKTITAAIVAALDDKPQAIGVSGYRVIVFEIQSTTYLRDPDGVTRHAVVTFHALVEAS